MDGRMGHTSGGTIYRGPTAGHLKQPTLLPILHIKLYAEEHIAVAPVLLRASGMQRLSNTHRKVCSGPWPQNVGSTEFSLCDVAYPRCVLVKVLYQLFRRISLLFSPSLVC